METLEGPRAPFLLEQSPVLPDPHELARNPSEIAIERAKFLEGLLPLGDFYRVSRGEDESSMEYFLRIQSLDFWDKTVTALHADEAAFTAFTVNAAQRNPEIYFRCHEYFEDKLSQNQKDIYVNLYLSDYNNLEKLLFPLSRIVSPEQFQKYADRVVDRDEGDGNCSQETLLKALVHSSHSIEEKQEVVQKFLLSERWLAGDFDYPGYYYRDKKPTDITHDIQVSGLRQLIAMGVTDSQSIGDSLDKVIARNQDHREKTYYNKHAVAKRAILKFAGIIQHDNSNSELVMEIFKDSMNDEDIPIAALAALIEYGYITVADLNAPLVSSSAYNQSTVIARIASYREQLHLPVCERPPHTFNHECDEEISAIYQRYIVDNVSLATDGHYDYETTDRILNYRGKLRDEQKAVLKLLCAEIDDADSRPCFSATFRVDDIATIFADEPETTVKIVRSNVEAGGALDFQNWSKWAEMIGLTQADVQQRFIDNFKGMRAYRVAHGITCILQNNAGLFSLEEAAEMMKQIFTDIEISPFDHMLISSACKSYFGRELTEKLFGEINVADIQNRLHPADELLDEALGADIHDLYSTLRHVSTNCLFLEENNFRQLVDKCLDVLSDEQIMESLPYMWDSLTKPQKDQVIDLFLMNPAAAESYLQYPEYKYMMKDYTGRHELTDSDHKDILSRLAPKSFTVFTGRLNAIGNKEKARNHLLMQHAYYYDLCNRVADVEGVEALIPTLRGKYEAKNELCALEIVTVLKESAGIQQADVLRGLSRADCEDLALCSIANRLGVAANRADQLILNLRGQGIDITKFSMWVHTSVRSSKLTDYMKPFLTHLSQGGDLRAWKFSVEGNNNLANVLSPATLAKWQADDEFDLILPNNKPHKIRYSHDLEAAYLAGARPSSNCLHYAYGLNQHALAGLLTADVKMLTMLNQRNRPTGNAIVRIVSSEDKPYVLFEPVYDSESDTYQREELNRAIFLNGTQYAEHLGLPMAVSDLYHGRLNDVAQAQYYLRDGVEEKILTLVKSAAPFSYSDTSGVGSKIIEVPAIVEHIA